MNIAIPLPWVGAAGAAVLALGALLGLPRSHARWAFAAGMLALAAEGLCAGFATHLPLQPGSWIRWEQGKLLAASFLPGCWIWFSLCYARGNAGEFLSRWRLPLAGMFVLPVGVAAAGHNRLVLSLYAAGPGRPWRFGLGWPGLIVNLFLLGGSILILMNLERTFRASVGTLRWRIKFMLTGIGLLFAVRIYETSQSLLFRTADPSLDGLNGVTLVAACFLALHSFYRSRRVELDVYPSLSVLRGSLAVLFAGIYLVLVGIGAKAVALFGGSGIFARETFLFLVSLVLLAALLQSDRLRMRLGRFVSRHFQRPLYDYRAVWRKFNDATASELDQAEFCRSLAKLAAEVFQCLSVAVWLVEDQTLTLSASTFLSETQGRALAPGPADTAAVLAHFQAHPEPVDLESERAEWAATLRRLHPSDFPRHETRVCLAMIPRGQIAALMILGDRVAGVPFRAQDFDMLTCVGEHATARLLTLQLGRRLLQAKELEAFQSMAAFFVHDLKNAASTLSLMLENLPVHFEDPAFREDALRGVSKSVQHVNHLIGRLSLLRRELKIQPVESDLNAVVAETVADLESDPEFHIRQELSQLPSLPLDPEQIAKVITNLVLNAKDAMSGKGEIRLSTRCDRGWAILTVTDQGCGMTADFIARSLFRPFQTTKKNGLGIGMFQSRMIVEVHGGRIEVSSKPGTGTDFQVLLPLPRN